MNPLNALTFIGLTALLIIGAEANVPEPRMRPVASTILPDKNAGNRCVVNVITGWRLSANGIPVPSTMMLPCGSTMLRMAWREV